MMLSGDRHSLSNIIGGDIVRVGKLPLLCLVLALCSAMAVVLTTHKTRLLMVEREQLILEREALDIEWRNLILEENALGDHSRVEQIATEKLHMQHVSPAQENIIVQ